MAGKAFLFNDHASIAILRGVRTLAQAVKATLGPKGRNAMIHRSGRSPRMTKDGVTVAQEIELPDPFENMGAQLVREAARKTGDRTGDGTTTAIVLAEAMVREGVKQLAAGASAQELKRGMDRAVDQVLTELQRISRPCRTTDALRQVAIIAVNHDVELGALIAEAVHRVGPDGIVTVEHSGGATTRLDRVEGLRFDSGYLSPAFVTDADRMRVVFEQPALLICDQTLSTLHGLLPLLDNLAKQQVPVLIVAADVQGEALSLLVLNATRHILQVAAVKAPGYGDRRTALLEDLASLTGGQAIVADTGRRLTSVKLEDLGRAARVVIDCEHTTVIGGYSDPERIQSQLQQIKAEMAESASDEERKRLQQRIAQLAGGVAVLHVGASTETEFNEKKARIEDAIQAAQAALEEGVVPGGGLALYRCTSVLKSLQLPGDQQLGAAIVGQALEAPLRQIAENAGHSGSVVAGHVSEQDVGTGFDAVTESFVDMVAAGILDPTKVTRSALLHAGSVAGLLLTTDVMVTDSHDDGIEVPGSETLHV